MFCFRLLFRKHSIVPVPDSIRLNQPLERKRIFRCKLLSSRARLEDGHITPIHEWADANYFAALNIPVNDRLMPWIDFHDGLHRGSSGLSDYYCFHLDT